MSGFVTVKGSDISKWEGNVLFCFPGLTTIGDNWTSVTLKPFYISVRNTEKSNTCQTWLIMLAVTGIVGMNFCFPLWEWQWDLEIFGDFLMYVSRMEEVIH